MNQEKRNKLKNAGWKEWDAQEFLDLSDWENQYIDLKLSLSQLLQSKRKQQELTQAELARLIKSSQSRIAKMENGDPGVSLDLIIKTLLSLGIERDELPGCFLSPEKV